MHDSQHQSKEEPSSSEPQAESRAAAPTSGGSLQLKGGGFAEQSAELSPEQPVQLRAFGPGTSGVHAAAAHGLQGGGGSLPYLGAIQRSFGRHNVANVQAHVGGAAKEATQAMGATAYASGNSTVFGEHPSKHTAAHEAAHVIQQRAGVQLSGGVGRAGDRYEQHADAVADTVTRGASAEGLLDQMAPSGAGGGAVQGIFVQRTLDYSDIDIKVTLYHSLRKNAIEWACSKIRQAEAATAYPGLKIALIVAIAAGAGALGAVTGGLGPVAMAAIGGASGALLTEGVNAAFSGGGRVNADDIELKLKNAEDTAEAAHKTDMQGRIGDQSALQTALQDYTVATAQRQTEVGNHAKNLTADAWMNAKSADAHGTGGSGRSGDTPGAGSEELTSATTGRLHFAFRVEGNSEGGGVTQIVGTQPYVASAEGLRSADLRRMYVNRPLSSIGCYMTVSPAWVMHMRGGRPQNGASASLLFQGGRGLQGVEGASDHYRSCVGKLTAASNDPRLQQADYNWAGHFDAGAALIWQAMGTVSLRDLHIVNVSG